jgi:hypothetical protein
MAQSTEPEPPLEEGKIARIKRRGLRVAELGEAKALIPPDENLANFETPPFEGLRSGIDETLRDAINPRAPGLIDAINRAVRYANVRDGERPASLSRRVLMLGIVDAGLSSPSAHRSSAWLIPWARSLEKDLEGMLRAQDHSGPVEDALARNPHVELNSTVVPVLERARRIAFQTVGRNVIDLRHLLYALTENPGRSFANFSRQPSPTELAQLRRTIVNNVEKGPEKGEDADQWRRLLQESTETRAPGPAPDLPRGGARPKGEKGRREPHSTQSAEEYYRTQTDGPAARDALDRESFARVLSERIRRLRAADGDNEKGAFMLHIHGRWGSGKSSVLNFLKEKLEREEGFGKPARVVTFNAWENNSRKPPWWPFLSNIYLTLLGDKVRPLPWGKRWRLRLKWWWWRMQADVIPLLLILLVFGLAVFEIGRNADAVDKAVKIVGAAATASALIYAYGRSLMFGSQRAAQTYSDLKADPLRRVIGLFNNIVEAVDEPLVVIIDDLDRCNADFIVDLLEGIQNLFKGKAVTYVAAADRKWICTAFEKRYADFADRIAEPARPLGYLFLEKMFQISAGMPKLTRDLQKRYLGTLTGPGIKSGEVSEAAKSEARSALAGATTEAQIQETVKSVEGDPERLRAYREEAAIKITTPPLAAATENRLQPLLPLMEANPRAMKRLVNEVAIAQARGLLEGRSVLPEARARWAMITQRWPQFAEYLADRPEAIAAWRPARAGEGPRGPIALEDLPLALRPLIGNVMVASTVGAPRDKGALTEKILGELLR